MEITKANTFTDNDYFFQTAFFLRTEFRECSSTATYVRNTLWRPLSPEFKMHRPFSAGS